MLLRMGITSESHRPDKTGTPSPFDGTQKDTIDKLLTVYLEREKPRAEVLSFFAGDEKCLIIVGNPGGGKSAFMASLIRDRQSLVSCFAYHLITDKRKDWKGIIASLLYQIGQSIDQELDYPIAIPNKGQDDETVVQLYREGLSQQAHSSRPGIKSRSFS